jgi:hypothetical protein
MPSTSRRNILFSAGFWLPVLGCAASEQTTQEAAEKAAILKVITDMQAAWNRGDFRGYMQGFKNPDVIFVSGGRFQAG